MTHNLNLPERVDFLLGQPKRMAGVGSWQPTDYPNQVRWQTPLSISGEITNLSIQLNSYPTYPFLKFSILLIYQSCVSRLDYSEADRHNNRTAAEQETPAGVQLGWLNGPHFHGWWTNRGFATATALPKELRFAISLPQNVRGFPNAFRWFCGETNILVGAGEVPELPERERLI